MPQAGQLPLLPRRVRLSLEIERASDLKYRTRLALEILPDSSEMLVQDDERLPARGELVLVNEEWMELGTRSRGTVALIRGRRGTRPARHAAGSIVHHGAHMERELIVPAVREDWDL